MNSKKTLLLGASPKPERYSFKAMSMLSRNSVPTIAIGKGEYHVGDVEVLSAWDYDKITDIDTVTLYLGQKNQDPYVEDILDLKPKRVIFNPGTENPGLELLLTDSHIDFIHACTLVLLSTGQY